MVPNFASRRRDRRCDGVGCLFREYCDGRRRGSRRAGGSRSQSIAAAPTRFAGALPDFAALAEHYGPAVVNVAVVGKRQEVDFPGGGMSPNDPFYEFFRRFGQPMPRNQPPVRGEGSGFIVSADGYILTNAHVVANADEVTVKTTDRREYTAKVVGVGRADRRRGAEDRREEPADRAARRSVEAAARRMGRRDRLAVRLREQRHRGHRQRDFARHARRQLHAVHPDGRRGQSRQLRRPAVQPERRSRRHQLADLQPHRRLHGRVVRDPDRRREQRQGPAHQDRARRRAAASASRSRT